MKTEKIFEFATRNKVRFPFKGMISVEDLWDLSLTNLDTIYKTLNKQVKQSEEESLLCTKSNVDAELEVQIAIVKHIVVQSNAKIELYSEQGKGTEIRVIFPKPEGRA